MDRVVDGARSDGALVEALIAGEDAALGELYRRHAPALLGAAFKLCRDRSDAEDILHDVFLEAWRSGSSYDASRGSVVSWLGIRLRSRVLDHLKRRSRRAALSHTFAPVATLPIARALTTERLAVLRVLGALKQKTGALLVAAHVEEWTGAELAATEGIPPATVKSRLATARDQFRIQLRRIA